jgi:hypothetical protein
MHNEVITMCLHCWTLLPRHMDTTLGDEEDQVHAACLA